MIVINTDAHNMDTLSHMEIGVSAAKKDGFKSSVLNALEINELLDFLHRRDKKQQ